jgi:peptidoglycan/LPS O-acetylase OafA/YrhL
VRVAGGKKLSIGEWVIAFGLVALAVAVTEFAGVSQKWENAIVYTVLVFTAVIIALRPAWGRRALWQNLVPVFLLHVLAVVVIEQSLPPGSEGPHGLPLIAVGMAESVLVAGVLWKRSMRSDSHPS